MYLTAGQSVTRRTRQLGCNCGGRCNSRPTLGSHVAARLRRRGLGDVTITRPETLKPGDTRTPLNLYRVIGDQDTVPAGWTVAPNGIACPVEQRAAAAGNVIVCTNAASTGAAPATTNSIVAFLTSRPIAAVPIPWWGYLLAGALWFRGER